MSYTPLSQADWYAKLKKFVPSWYFEQQEQTHNITVATFQAIAACFNQWQTDAIDQFNATFLTEATTPVLDESGEERGIPRYASEIDSDYFPRIQNIFYNSAVLSRLQALVDATLNNGSALFILNIPYGFSDDVFFYDDADSRILDRDKQKDFFTVIVPIQTAGDEAAIRTAIISALEHKAFGVSYDVLYRSSADTDTAD